MDILLAAIQTALQDAARIDAIPGLKPANIYVTPNVNYIPESMVFPAVGIKDGQEDRSELIGGCLDVTRQVYLVCSVKNNGLTVGDGVFDVLKFAKEVRAFMDNNTLNLRGYDYAFCPKESGTRIDPDKSGGLIERKILQYHYTAREQR